MLLFMTGQFAIQWLMTNFTFFTQFPMNIDDWAETLTTAPKDGHAGRIRRSSRYRAT